MTICAAFDSISLDLKHDFVVLYAVPPLSVRACYAFDVARASTTTQPTSIHAASVPAAAATIAPHARTVASLYVELHENHVVLAPVSEFKLICLII